MKPLLRTLAILASLALSTQTVRHAYLLWLEPRTSVLDQYDHPLRNEIAAARSLDDLLSRYDVVRKEADRLRAERQAANPRGTFDDQFSEPFKSEHALREAVSSWEDRANEVRSLRFYWLIGLVFSAVGVVGYLKGNRWAGVTLMSIGFSEVIYWTSPTFFGTTTREFDRLLAHKLAFSLVSMVFLGFAIRLLGAFREDGPTGR